MSPTAAPIPTGNRLYAVLDDAGAADSVVAELVAAGVDADSISVLTGADGAAQLAPRPSAWTRAMRLLSFIAADQAVDMDWYRAALETGRAVLVMATPTTAVRRAAIDALRRCGAHFVNHYGWMATEDVIPWRGEPPPVHWLHHR